MKKKQLIALGVIILAFAAACSNPFFPEREDKGGNTEFENDITAIRNVSLTVISPVKNGAPDTTATAGGEGYTCSEVSWSPEDNPFLGETVYTATVTLTAADGHSFIIDSFTATVNGEDATVSNNTGAAVTLSLEFDATLSKTVTNISIKTQPTKLAYTHGDLLDLSGFTVTLTFDDDTSEDIALADFGTNISTRPANEAALSHTDHNEEPVVVSFGDLTANTNNLTVAKADPTVTWPTGITATYGQTLSNISLTSYTNSGGTAGTFSWTTPSNSVGAIGTRSHNMTFTPNDTANYNTLTQNVSIKVVHVEMVRVEDGSFTMGSDSIYSSNERPMHTVTLSSFYIGKYEVTQKQWQDVMGSLPSSLTTGTDFGRGDNYPVYYVNWYDALVFCNKLSIAEGLSPAYRINNSTNPADWGTVPTSSNATWNAAEIVSGSTGYRLPTEAQWEYAAKGGNGSPGNYTYAGSNTIGDVAYLTGGTKPVGTKAPNGLGLYDMSGSVQEWCWNWYEDYTSDAQFDPQGASSGSLRMLRGGSWFDDERMLRSACRYGTDRPYFLWFTFGFRLVRPTGAKTYPAVTWPTGLTATYGQTLSDISLPGNGSGSPAGTFKWTTPDDSVGAVGARSHSMTFTPNDTANYNTLTQNVRVTVNKANPTVTWPTGLTAINGQTLSNISLTSYTNSGGTAGTFKWTTPSASVGAVGTQSHSMTFTPTDTANYNTLTQNVSINVVRVEMVFVARGSFQMGQNGDRSTDNVTPVHQVTLTSDFYIGKYEVTQAQWQAVMGSLPSNLTTGTNYGRGDNYPVYYVSWYDALVFCNKLSIAEGLSPAYRINGSTDPSAWGTVPTSQNTTWNAATIASGSTGYRLPTEAQWEYAAKGGQNMSAPPKIYSGSDTADDVAWYDGNNGSSGTATYGTKQVGTKAANELGIYDMSGNVQEWCRDWYEPYSSEAQTDPTGGASTYNNLRVHRGGFFNRSVSYIRSVGTRNCYDPSFRLNSLGFRLVRPGN